MYRRFLNNNDYLGIITPEVLAQLTRGNGEHFVRAEEAAEASVVEYLSENWTVECSIFQVTHTITTFPQADSEQNIVVGDLYKRFGHECSIVEYPEPLWSD